MAMLQSPLQVQLEKLAGRIAVSPAARKTIVEHLGGDAVVIPNGVHVDRYAAAPALNGWPGEGALGFVGRIDEPRKGLDVLLDAMPLLWRSYPPPRVLVARARGVGPAPRPRITGLGEGGARPKNRGYPAGEGFFS